jgi:hypothetical protein
VLTNLPLIQSMMRHAKPTTAAIYIHRVNSAQMARKKSFLRPSTSRLLWLKEPWVESWVGGGNGEGFENCYTIEKKW